MKLWDRTNLGEKEVEDVYWFMAQGASKGVASFLGLYNIRELNLHEFPGMPTKTSTSRHAKVVWGTSPYGKRILLILNTHLEGMQEFESWFVVQLLKHKGIQQIKFIIESSSTNMSNEFCPGNFAVVTDYLDKGNFPAIISMREYFQFRSINRNLARHLSKRLGERLGQDHIYSDETTMIQFDGPALPSNANIRLGKYIGC